MEMKSVSSSMIAAVGYDAGAQVMDVQFNSKSAPGPTWRYSQVTPAEYESVVGSPSIGKAFTSTIKGSHPANRID